MYETIECPECRDGIKYVPCKSCKGVGHFVKAGGWKRMCTTCKGEGEIAGECCSLCGCTGVITSILYRLHYEYKHRQIIEIPNNPLDPYDNGVTRISLQKYYYFRHIFHEAVKAEGYVGGIHDQDNYVLLTAKNGQVLRFGGFSWGYGGEGPMGLCYVLTDTGFFQTIEEAKEFVFKQYRTSRWSLG